MRLSAEEIALIIGVSERRIRQIAAREGWFYTEVKSKGRFKKKLYDVFLIPNEEIKRKVLAARLDVPALAPMGAIKAMAEPKPIKPKFPISIIPKKYIDLGLFRAELVIEFNNEREWAKENRELLKAQGKTVVEHLEEWLERYNNRLVLPHVYNVNGPVKDVKTLYKWAAKYKKWGFTGICGWSPREKVEPVNETVKKALLSILLHPNRVSPASAARTVKEEFEKRGIPCPSEKSMLRWIEGFKKRNNAVWVLARKGQKALKDKNAPYVMRNWSALSVGDLLIADGHRLDFPIINPYTGKPKRMTMVMFYDAASRFPVGWEIMPEENIQCVHSALWNAIITLGKIPKWVLLDNGKAFKARVFTGKLKDVDFEKTGMKGLYEQLGIKVHFAKPYEPQVKTIERFFNSFNEIERMIPAYTGASPVDRPAIYKRNEKALQKIYAKDGVRLFTVEEVNSIFAWWIQEKYGKRPHAGLNGRKPLEVFLEGRGKGINLEEFADRFLMEKKCAVRNSMISLFSGLGLYYFHPALYNISGKVRVRFTLSNLERVYLYDEDGVYLGMAQVEDAVSAFYKVSGDEKDYEAVKQKIKRKESLLKASKKELKRILKETEEVANLLTKPADVSENGKLNTVFNTPAFSSLQMEKLDEYLEKKQAREIVHDIRGNTGEVLAYYNTLPPKEKKEDKPKRPLFRNRLERFDWLVRQYKKGNWEVITEKDIEFIKRNREEVIGADEKWFYGNNLASLLEEWEKRAAEKASSSATQK